MSKKKGPKYTHWQQDQDYLHKLSPEQRKWVEEFNAREYVGIFDIKMRTRGWQDKRRKIWTAAYNQRWDLLNIARTSIETIRELEDKDESESDD